MSAAPPLQGLALQELYRRHIGMLRRRATQLVGEGAWGEDLAQEAFMRLLEHRQRGGSEQDTAAFLFQVTTRLAYNALRDRKNRQRLLRQHHETQDAGDAGAMPAVALQRDLRLVLAQVSEEEACCAMHHYLDQMDHEEIAQLTGLQRRTVGRRLESFRRRAASLLAGQR